MVSSFVTAAVVIIILMSGLFVLAMALKDNSIADIAYGLIFTAVAWTTALGSEDGHPRQMLLLFMVTVWGVRLAVHLSFRKRGKGEDFRYRKWREKWGRAFAIRSFLQVFLLQGLVILIVSSPVIAGIASPGGSLGYLDVLGVIVWFLGIFFEAVGDWQLMAFRKNPENKGRIMTTGLWRYSRHPNYFGEAVLWWGVYLVSLGSPYAWWTILSPLTIDFLLLKVSGIPMLEKRYEGNAEFEKYRERTSPFLPWFPREGATRRPPE